MEGVVTVNYYPYQPHYYPQPGLYQQPDFPHVYGQQRQVQPIDSSILYQSANQTKKLMKDANLVLNKLAQSKEFDAKLMYAAQASHTEEVKRLIRSIGVTSDIAVHYTPDELRLEFKSVLAGEECCKVMIALRWRR